MERPRRILMGVLTAASLLLFIAAIRLWVRSYDVRDDLLTSESASRRIHLVSTRGWLALDYWDYLPATGGHDLHDEEYPVVPYAFAAMSFAVLPCVWMVQNRRRRFVRSGGPYVQTCRACGYDLRATPGRCPECGLVAAELAAS
jgi:hypothetical protein